LEVAALLVMVTKHCGTAGNSRINKSSWGRWEGKRRFIFEVQTRHKPYV
jgi:hypothetical protein